LKARRKKYQQHTDEQLSAEYLKTGNKLFIGILFDRYATLVYGLCLKYLKNEDDSKDAVLQIFEMLMTELSKKQITYFRSWLFVLSKNHCLMQIRSTTRRTGREALYAGQFETSHKIEFVNEPTITDDIIVEKINHLKEDQRLCITLFYLEEKSYNEITTITGLDYNQVKSAIQNGKRNLKTLLQPLYTKENERIA
jgi:RNA polymerase sigma factor (sigma-70 family)